MATVKRLKKKVAKTSKDIHSVRLVIGIEVDTSKPGWKNFLKKQLAKKWNDHDKPEWEKKKAEFIKKLEKELKEKKEGKNDKERVQNESDEKPEAVSRTSSQGKPIRRVSSDHSRQSQRIPSK